MDLNDDFEPEDLAEHADDRRAESAGCSMCNGSGSVVRPEQVQQWIRSGKSPEWEPESLDCPRCQA